MAAETLLESWSSPITAGAEDVLDRARTHGWTIVSIKDDWRTVFADR